MKELTKKPRGFSRPNLITTPNLSETFKHLIQASLLHWPPDDFSFLSRLDHKNITKTTKTKTLETKNNEAKKTVNSYLLPHHNHHSYAEYTSESSSEPFSQSFACNILSEKYHRLRSSKYSLSALFLRTFDTLTSSANLSTFFPKSITA
jgi:hypothetical protein